MGWQEGGMTKEEFMTDAEVWAKPYGKDNARTAAKWVAENLGPSRQHASCVSSLAAILQEHAKSGNLSPVSPISPEAAARSDALERWVRPWAEAIRQALFKTTAPPFATLEDAIAWIERESQQYQRQAAGRAKRLTAWRRQAQQAADRLAGNGFLADVTLHSLIIRYPQGGAPVAIPANGPALHRLATEVTALDQATGWGELQTLVYLLVKGVEPVIPRYTLRVTLKTANNRQGESRSRHVSALTLNSADLSFSELRQLYKALRQQGIAKKKPVTKRALEVWRFVQKHRPPMIWADCLKAWNAGHKRQDQYRSPKGFRKAWERVDAVMSIDN